MSPRVDMDGLLSEMRELLLRPEQLTAGQAAHLVARLLAAADEVGLESDYAAEHRLRDLAEHIKQSRIANAK